ncbi:MAG TPA: hypothetical protein VLC10_02990 [Patescibacteria group bacterium]|nr:hypothetical protein [Patescibacteria group bacterium]
MDTRDKILIALAIILLLLLLLLLLSRLFRRMRNGGGGAGGGGGGSSESPGERAAREARARAQAEAARAAREAAERSAAGKVQEVMAADPRLVERMLGKAGEQHGPLRDVSLSAEDALRIARTLGPQGVETFWLAASQKDVSFDLRRESSLERSHYPTGDISPEPMGDFAQLPAVLPEQLIMPDEQFYPALADQSLTVLQSYERKDARKRLYILLDVSGSMEDPMENGMPRHVWARGVTVNLLLEAVRGDAEYLFRPFDGQSHERREAATPEQAEKLIDHILSRGFSGNGTNLMNAVRTAAKDIRSLGNEVERSELLLITDGQDQSMDDEAAVRKVLGDDIRLHVVLIGTESPALKRVASTYRSLR